jgi:hypothetical protein
MLVSDHYPLSPAPRHEDAKDPCAVPFRGAWHLYGSGGCSKTNRWGVLHWTAPHSDGPWTDRGLIFLSIPGNGVAAPGVIPDGDRLQMLIQTEYDRTGGRIERFTSDDGDHWIHHGTTLESLPGTDQAGIYDPHPAIIDGWPYFTYSAFPDGTRKPQPDIYLARSATGSWNDPWLRMGKILDHRDVADHHNDRDHPDYEWGLEGSQLIELPNGRILLNAVCFLPDGPEGERQRVFFALADTVLGPYRTIGPVVPTPFGGENGHASGWCDGNRLRLLYQSRTHITGMSWRYGLATYDLAALSQRG